MVDGTAKAVQGDRLFELINVVDQVQVQLDSGDGWSNNGRQDHDGFV